MNTQRLYTYLDSIEPSLREYQRSGLFNLIEN